MAPGGSDREEAWEVMRKGTCTPAQPRLMLLGDQEARKWRHILPTPLEHLFVKKWRTGWVEKTERQGHTQNQKIQTMSLPLMSSCLPFGLFQSHRPQWQEVENLPSDPSGMFASSVSAAAEAAAQSRSSVHYCKYVFIPKTWQIWERKPTELCPWCDKTKGAHVFPWCDANVCVWYCTTSLAELPLAITLNGQSLRLITFQTQLRQQGHAD